MTVFVHAVILYGKIQYLVLWSGYPKEAATWEAVEDNTDSAVRYSSTFASVCWKKVLSFMLPQNCFAHVFLPDHLPQSLQCAKMEREGLVLFMWIPLLSVLVDSWEASDCYNIMYYCFVIILLLLWQSILWLHASGFCSWKTLYN